MNIDASNISDKIMNWSQVMDLKKGNTLFSSGAGVSVGSFDGVHKGHQKIIKTLVEKCKKENLIPCVVSFSEPIPGAMKLPSYPGNLSTADQRVNWLGELGVEFFITVDFDSSFMNMSGEDFFDVLIEKFNLKYIVEGFDFKCGYKGLMNKERLSEYSKGKKIEVDFIDPYFLEDLSEMRVSSTLIRKTIAEGNLQLAEKLLGRPYELDFSSIKKETDKTYLKEKIRQVLPPEGKYSCRSYSNAELIVNISGKNLGVVAPDGLFIETSSVRF